MKRISDSKSNDFLAPPCGLYCGCCADYVKTKECHGCGCNCGKCAGKFHSENCKINQCAKKRKLDHCGDCSVFPCTMLIQFAYDPIWRTHLPVIENLRHRKKIGTANWLKEQANYWSDKGKLNAEIRLHDECAKKCREQDIK